MCFYLIVGKWRSDLRYFAAGVQAIATKILHGEARYAQTQLGILIIHQHQIVKKALHGRVLRELIGSLSSAFDREVS
jgi:hypothetical protein